MIPFGEVMGKMDRKAMVIMALTGLLAGYLASFLVGPSSWGLLGYMVSGVLGAFVGGFVLNFAGINLGFRNPFLSQVAVSTIGAIIVVIAARIIA